MAPKVKQPSFSELKEAIKKAWNSTDSEHVDNEDDDNKSCSAQNEKNTGLSDRCVEIEKLARVYNLFWEGDNTTAGESDIYAKTPLHYVKAMKPDYAKHPDVFIHEARNYIEQLPPYLQQQAMTDLQNDIPFYLLDPTKKTSDRINLKNVKFGLYDLKNFLASRYPVVASNIINSQVDEDVVRKSFGGGTFGLSKDVMDGIIRNRTAEIVKQQKEGDIFSPLYFNPYPNASTAFGNAQLKWLVENGELAKMHQLQNLTSVLRGTTTYNGVPYKAPNFVVSTFPPFLGGSPVVNITEQYGGADDVPLEGEPEFVNENLYSTPNEPSNLGTVDEMKKFLNNFTGDNRTSIEVLRSILPNEVPPVAQYYDKNLSYYVDLYNKRVQINMMNDTFDEYFGLDGKEEGSRKKSSKNSAKERKKQEKKEKKRGKHARDAKPSFELPNVERDHTEK